MSVFKSTFAVIYERVVPFRRSIRSYNMTEEICAHLIDLHIISCEKFIRKMPITDPFYKREVKMNGCPSWKVYTQLIMTRKFFAELCV